MDFLKRCEYCEKLYPRKKMYKHSKTCQAKKIAMELYGSDVPEVRERLYPIGDPEIIDISENSNNGERSTFDMVNNPPFTQGAPNTSMSSTNDVLIETTETEASAMTSFSEQLERQGWQSDEATETP
jgi:hypothetical protein